ncbi:ABC transporter permease [Pseudoleptotrichia goodfellowii]|jgi:ABC-type Fe3+ transport system, permease component|uniref:ABC transporter, permease protein n=2 Tax=Pseudoleptotrichia goodfellowii TaxID=157692 RepID=D0GL88_9FUSO|nr:iron ABC transporter permease [Pseudoleptotrichia goodfellowii]EEY35178.1 ABC transporter, permease protein [Pseudoleptotrichia goodfellowii F0264]MBF4805278.1 iron ABC transporter permease [Pseudoleptotrichia goodfellowii]BBM37172.1 binding-protein-dependent transport system innermembrane protein [Pseudoleptotrichia goodfellowii]
MNNDFKLKLNHELKNIRKLINDPVLLLTIIFSLAVVTFFVLVPLWNILLESLKIGKGKIGLENYIESFTASGNFQVILNTILLGFVTSIISLIIGFFFAYVSVYIKIKGKKIFDFIAMLPIISPPFVIALSAIMLFGRQGIITSRMLGMKGFEIYGFHGLVLVQVLSFFPIAYMMLVGLLQMIDPSVEEASRSLGASRLKVFTTITFPLMLPGLANAFLLVFIQSIADYANPFVIGGKFTTIAVKIFQEGVGNYELGIATALSIILLSLSITMFTIQRYYINKKSYVTVTGKVSRERELIDSKKIVTPIFTVLILLTSFVIIMYILIPLSSFVEIFGIKNNFTLRHYQEIFRFKNRIAPIIATTNLSLWATLIASVFSMIIAFLIVRKNFIGKTFIEFTTIMALAIPGTIIGIGYAISYNKVYKIPFTNITLIPTLTGTAFIIVMAFIIRSLPVGVRSGMSALNQIDPSIEEASTILGASSRQTFFKVTIPMIREAFLSGLIYSFARSMTLVSTVVFLISAKWKLLTPEIMNHIDQGRIGIASAYCTILIIIVSTFMIIVKILMSFTNAKK